MTWKYLSRATFKEATCFPRQQFTSSKRNLYCKWIHLPLLMILVSSVILQEAEHIHGYELCVCDKPTLLLMTIYLLFSAEVSVSQEFPNALAAEAYAEEKLKVGCLSLNSKL